MPWLVDTGNKIALEKDYPYKAIDEDCRLDEVTGAVGCSKAVLVKP